MPTSKSSTKKKRKGKQRVPIDDETDPEFQTQGFEPGDSDDDKLWEVVAARGERNGWYLIQWAGLDSSNGKPWPDSWVPRKHVTDNVIEEWNREEAERKKAKARKMAERRRNRRKNSGTPSASSSRTNSKRSTTTASTTTSRYPRRATSVNMAGVGLNDDAAARTSPVKKKRKQSSPSDHDGGPSTAEEGVPRKRRKLSPLRISRRTSPRKGTKARPPESDLEDGEGEENQSDDEIVVRSPRVPKNRSRREEEEESEDADASHIKRINKNERPADTGHRQMPQSNRPIVHEHEAEEDEESTTDAIAKSPLVSKGKRRRVDVVVEVKGPSRGKHKMAPNGKATLPVPEDGQQSDRGTSDRGPTPPRRTLVKSRSGRTGNSKFVAPPNGVINGKKRQGPPGVRTSEIRSPGSELVTKRSSRSRSRSIGSDRTEAVSPNKLRQGLTGRMKGKERMKSDTRSDTLRAASVGQGREARGNIVDGSTDHLISGEVVDERVFENNDDQGMFPDPFDELPFSQDPDASAAWVASRHDLVSSRGAGDAIPAHCQAGDRQTSKGTIIPPTQSQSQSQSQQESQQESQPQSHDVAQDDLYLESIIAERGSDAVDIDMGVDEASPQPSGELPESPGVGEATLPISSSIPEPESSMASGGNEKLYQRIPIVTPSKFRPYLPQQKPLSALPPPHAAVASPSQDSGLLTSSVESPIRDFDGEDGATDKSAKVGVVDPNDTLEIAVGVEGNDQAIMDRNAMVEVVRNGTSSSSEASQVPPNINGNAPSVPPVPSAPGSSSATAANSASSTCDRAFSNPDHLAHHGSAHEPYHPQTPPAPNAYENSNTSNDGVSTDVLRSIELRRRGLELAEIQRKRLRESKEYASRIPLGDLLEMARTSSSRAQSEQGDTSNPSVFEGDSEHATPEIGEEDEVLVRQFEAEFIDFDGNANTSYPRPCDTRSSTDADRSSMDDEDERPTGRTEGEAYEEAEIESSLRETFDENDPFISRGGEQSREVTPTTTTSQQDDTELYTPVRTRFKILGSPTKLVSPVVQTPSRQLNEAMGLLHAKSEEIEVLKRQLAASERKRINQDDALANLQAEVTVLKKTQEEKGDSSEVVDASALEQYKEQCDELTKDLDARDAEIKLLKMNRDDATNRAELFQELYGQASSFADEKKQENDELVERAKRAEGQVTTGLDLVRRQYAAQEGKLKEELEQRQVLITILLAKDRRTDDEVRRRAALEPELRGKIDELREEIADLKVSQSNIVHQRNDLLVEKQKLHEELEGLKVKYEKTVDDLSWSQIQIARLMAREKAFKRVFLTASTSPPDNESDRDEERVYICKWINGYEAKSRCNSLFTSVQDLKDHLFVDHQL